MFLCKKCNSNENCLCEVAGKSYGPCEQCGKSGPCVDHHCYKPIEDEEEEERDNMTDYDYGRDPDSESH